MQIMIDPIASARVPIVIDADGDKPAPLEPHMIENKSTEDGNSASGETIHVDPPLAASEDKPWVVHEFVWGAKRAACQLWAKLCADEN